MDYIENAQRDCEKIKKNILKINDRNFFNRIIERGKEYFKLGKVKKLIKLDDTKYSAIVDGSEHYNVIVKLQNKYCIDAKCTCPFNVADEGYINPKLCKHIYATYMAIYESENKEYLNNALLEYTEKYYSYYLKLTNEINKFELKKTDKKLYQKNNEEFIELYNQTKSIINTNFDVQTTLENLCNFITKSGEIFDSLGQINILYKEKSYDGDKYIENSTPQADTNEHKVSFIENFFKILFAIILAIINALLTALTFGMSDEASDEISDETSNNENTFSYGDTVMVKYSGKFGVIVSQEGNYYTVKLKDENEDYYYASYYRNELELY